MFVELGCAKIVEDDRAIQMIITKIKCKRSKSNQSWTKQLMNSAQTQTNTTQNEVTERLGEGLQNINLWKFELEKFTRDMTAEIELLVVEKRRLEYAIQV